MAQPHNPDRFVIIDGVQTSRARAERLGLIKADPAPGVPDGPRESRARSPKTSRRRASTSDASPSAADD